MMFQEYQQEHQAKEQQAKEQQAKEQMEKMEKMEKITITIYGSRSGDCELQHVLLCRI